MLGAIIGDMVGSVYEFNNTKKTDFPFFSGRSTYTDDSIMTVAVAQWLLSDKCHSCERLESLFVEYANEYPHPMGGYGGGFATWLFHPENLIDYRTGKCAERRVPYNSWGNGAAMRVSAVGWFFDTLEETERVAKISAEITHNHPEGIRGAQSTAAAIWMARNGKSKEEIKEYIEIKYGYDLSRTWEYLNRTYDWDSSCQGTVPEAIIAFLESNDFEDAIRKAVSMGGDSDTLACITGGIAEAFYKEVPVHMIEATQKPFPPIFHKILDAMKHRTSYGKV
mgnify:CR=1 FL=1